MPRLGVRPSSFPIRRQHWHIPIDNIGQFVEVALASSPARLVIVQRLWEHSQTNQGWQRSRPFGLEPAFAAARRLSVIARQLRANCFGQSRSGPTRRSQCDGLSSPQLWLSRHGIDDVVESSSASGLLLHPDHLVRHRNHPFTRRPARTTPHVPGRCTDQPGQHDLQARRASDAFVTTLRDDCLMQGRTSTQQ